MKKILLIFTIATASICLGQEIECQYAPSADYTGKCESFYANGNIRSQTNFLNSMRHGDHVEYYENGQISATAKFHEEAYIGKALRYSEDGIVQFEMELDSTETGNFTYYDQGGKNVLVTGQFKNGYRDDEWVYYDSYGNEMVTLSFDSDKTHLESKSDLNTNIRYVPYDETIDKLFLEDYGMPIEVMPETIIDFPDVEPEYRGGDAAMKRFIQETVSYPLIAVQRGEHGKVYISFVVELDGSISNVKVVRGVSESLDKEAIRTIKSMPKWIPGAYNGKNVRSRCRLPITFILTGTDKGKKKKSRR